MLDWAIVSDNLEHNSVHGDYRKLVLEVILVSIGPAIDVVGLNFDHERPVWVVLLFAILVKLGKLHDGHGACMIRNLGQMLANCLSGAIVVHFLQNIGPPVLEKVEGRLSVEGKHCEPVGRGHTVSQKFHRVARCSLWIFRRRQRELRNPVNGVFAPTEDTSVGSMGGRDKLKQSDHAARMRLFDSADWHGVGDDVERMIHILFKEACEIVACEEPLRSVIAVDSLPDDSLLAAGRQGLVIVSVQLFELLEPLDGTILRVWTR